MQITVTTAGTGHTYTHVYNLNYASAIMCFNSFHIFRLILYFVNEQMFLILTVLLCALCELLVVVIQIYSNIGLKAH